MDESHLRAAVSYVSLNPVRARLVSRAEEWAWSSVRAHLAGEDDGLVSVRPVLDRWPNFRDLLLQDHDEAFTSLRRAEGIGRPLGAADFVIELERRLGRPIARRAPGRKAIAVAEGEQLKLLQ
jgi:putative transposase